MNQFNTVNIIIVLPTDLVNRLTETAKRIVYEVNGKTISGTLYGPLKMKRKSQQFSSFMNFDGTSPLNRFDLADTKRTISRKQAEALYSFYCKPLNLC